MKFKKYLTESTVPNVIKEIADAVAKKAKVTLINRTSGYSPVGYYDFAARLNPGKYEGVQITLSFKPDAIFITLGAYGMSNVNLDTVRYQKLKANASQAQIIKAFMKVLHGK